MISRRNFIMPVAALMAGAVLHARFSFGADAAGRPSLVLPTPQQVAWQDLDFGVLICTEPRVYNGDGNYANAAKVRANPAAYAERFKPAKLDTDQWVATAKALGANHAVLLVKQDTGFCLWQSQANPYSLKSISWRDGKADILRDFVASCRKYGIAPGIFTEARWDKRLGVDGFKVGANSPVSQGEYDRLVERELEELCTGYGELCEVWYDAGAGPYSRKFAEIFAKHQPRGVFYSHLAPGSAYRWGGGPENGMVDYPCWSTIDRAGKASQKLLGTGDPDGKDWIPARADVPLRCEKGVHQWYWHPGGERGVASVEHLKNIYRGSVGRNAKLEIGFTPNPEGLMDATDVAVCKEFGAWLEKTVGGKPLAEASGKGAELTLEIPETVRTPVTHIVVQEDIAQGERVCGYVIEAEVALRQGSGQADAWKQVAAGSCIGHKRIERIAPCEARKYRLRIIGSIAEPQIRKLAVFGGA
jgi:alpha-L-fucosidase